MKEKKAINAQYFLELLKNDNYSEYGIDVYLEDYQVSGKVIIKDSLKGIGIKNCVFNDGLFFVGKNKSVYISDSELESISINEIESFSLQSCSISAILFSTKTKVGYMSIGSLTENNPSLVGWFEFGGSTILRGSFFNAIILSLSINDCKLPNLSFQGKNFIEKYRLSGNHINNGIKHQSIVVSSLEIDDFIGGPNISFVNCKNDIQPDFESGKKILEKTFEEEFIKRNKKLEQENERYSDIKISVLMHVIEKKEIHIKNSNLDKIQFHNCDFRSSDILIENSNVSEIVSTNLYFPQDIRSESLDGKRETYRQLKYNFSKLGDSYSALRFYNKEMTVLLKSSVKNLKIGDSVILFLGKIVSGNGTNWIYALFWIIFSNSILFYYFLWFSGIDVYIGHESNLGYLISNIKYSYFLSDLNTIRPLLGQKENITNISELIFFVTKIINLFLFYHLVISFRKFNKKF